MNYLNQMRLLNVLPLPMFLQLSDLLLLVKLVRDDNCDLFLPEILDEESRQHEILKLPKRQKFVKQTTARGKFAATAPHVETTGLCFSSDCRDQVPIALAENSQQQQEFIQTINSLKNITSVKIHAGKRNQ